MNPIKISTRTKHGNEGGGFKGVFPPILHIFVIFYIFPHLSFSAPVARVSWGRGGGE